MIQGNHSLRRHFCFSHGLFLKLCLLCVDYFTSFVLVGKKVYWSQLTFSFHALQQRTIVPELSLNVENLNPFEILDLSSCLRSFFSCMFAYVFVLRQFFSRALLHIKPNIKLKLIIHQFVAHCRRLKGGFRSLQ